MTDQGILKRAVDKVVDNGMVVTFEEGNFLKRQDSRVILYFHFKIINNYRNDILYK